MDQNRVKISDPESLLDWKERYYRPITVDKDEAELLLSYLKDNDVSLEADSEGKLYWNPGNGEVEFLFDDVIDQVCEWNYEKIAKYRDLKSYSNSYLEACKYDNQLMEYSKHEEILDRLFDQTIYGKKLDEHMRQLVMKSFDDVVIVPHIDNTIKAPVREEKPEVRYTYNEKGVVI